MLQLFYLISTAGHGGYDKPQNPSTLVGSCQKCFRTRTWTQGIFCANFSKSLGTYLPCGGMWCGGCYTSDNTLHFHVASLGNEKGEKGRENQEESARMQTIWKGKIRDPTDFHVGRRGDHLMTPFECDLCIFRKLKMMDPDLKSPQDKLLSGLIRRMNLDAFWSRASSTVTKNAKRAEMMIELSDIIRLKGPFEEEQCYGLTDHCGYKVAATTLMQSRRPGRHSSIYTQFQTIRKQRTTFGNQVRAMSQSDVSPLVLLDKKRGIPAVGSRQMRFAMVWTLHGWSSEPNGTSVETKQSPHRFPNGRTSHHIGWKSRPERNN